MAKITIKEVSPSTGDKKPTIIVDDTGAKMSGFDTALKDLNPGDIIEVDLKPKGSYMNIVSWSLVQKAEGGPKHEKTNTYPADDTIIKAQIIAQLWIAGKINDDDELVKKLKKWLGKSEKPKASGDEKKTEEETEPGEAPLFITNVKELSEWAISHGKEFTQGWLCEVLGIAKLSEIKDFEQAKKDVMKSANWES